MNVDLLLYLGAFFCFMLAAFSVPRVRWEWLGVALLVLSLIV